MQTVSQVGRALVEKTFKQQKILVNLNSELRKIEHGSVHVYLPRTNLTLQQHGFIHGGLVSTVADTAAGLSAYTVLTNPEHSCVTVELKINFIRPADTGILAVGKLIKENKSLVICTAEVFTEDGKICAYMLQTVKKIT